MRPLFPLRHNKIGRAIAPQTSDQPLGFAIALLGLFAPIIVLRPSLESSFEPLFLLRSPTFRTFQANELLSARQISTIEIAGLIYLLILCSYALLFARNAIREFNDYGSVPDVLKTSWPRVIRGLTYFAALTMLVALFWGPIFQPAYTGSMKLVTISIIILMVSLSCLVEALLAVGLYSYCYFGYWAKPAQIDKPHDSA